MKMLRSTLSILFLILNVSHVLSQPACTVTATSTGNWNSTGTWTPAATPTSTDVVCWNNNTDVYFPQLATSAATNATIATMEMGNSDHLYVGQGDSNKDTLKITGDFYDGNSSIIYIASDGVLIINGNLNVNNGLILNVTAGGQLIVNGTVDINNAATLQLAGNVTIGGNFTIGNSGTIFVPNGGTVSVTGNLSAGNATCATIAGSFTVGGTCSGGGSNCSSSTSGGSGIGFCDALPIELLFFSGEEKTSSVHLIWATASEVNFQKFIIEKSLDGTNFFEIGSVKGHGTSNSRIDYFFDDEKPIYGRNYYRLTEIDLDQKLYRLQVIAIDFSSGKKLSVYPNPSREGKFNIEFNYIPSSGSQAYIYNLQGALMMSVQLDNQVQEIKHSLMPGLYIVKVFTHELSRTERIAVQEQTKE